jgi:hypothetical protein
VANLERLEEMQAKRQRLDRKDFLYGENGRILSRDIVTVLHVARR